MLHEINFLFYYTLQTYSTLSPWWIQVT